jgi:energy-coupling factor transporter ATP-binding protein EcfA2
MKTYSLTLESKPWDSFRCQKAANSLDIDLAKKLRHDFSVTADIETDFNVGVIVGASGSGKTTLAENIYGSESLIRMLDPKKPVIEQFPESFTYEECAKNLAGVGLAAVPCWIRPASTLSNGQKERAEIALQMARDDELVVIDEWTSVVDRTVGKIMSDSIQRWARRTNKQVILLSCHYDVLDWLQPDWVIDANKQTFVDRRLLRRSRKEEFVFDIREIGRESWKYFSKYHYLSDRLPGGHIELYGLFYGKDQIGFQCFANYVPYAKKSRASKREIMHMNRMVIHPDYVGLGLGLRLMNETSRLMHEKHFRVMTRFSSVPVFKALIKSDRWAYKGTTRHHKVSLGGSMTRDTGYRVDVAAHNFEYIPELKSKNNHATT